MKNSKQLYIGFALAFVCMALFGFGSKADALAFQGSGIVMTPPNSGGTSGYNNYGNYFGNYYNQYNNGVSQVSITTTGSNGMTTNSANLMGSWSTSSISQVGTWFLYGTTMNLGSTTVTRYQNGNNGNFVDTLYNLTPNTIYYYRAAGVVNGAVTYGQILTFQTTGGTTTTATTTTNTSSTNSTGSIGTTPAPFFGSPIPPAQVASTTTPTPANMACATDTVNYDLAYKNTTSATVTSAMLVMTMPNEVDYVSASAQAQYNAGTRTLTIFIGNMDAGQEGVVYVTGRANGNANGKDIIAARVDFTFTNSEKTNSTVTNYITHSGSACQGNLGAFALGTGFLPTSFGGWIILTGILCIIIYLSRKYFVNKKVEHQHMMHLEHQEH